jgi:hypothetical protein
MKIAGALANCADCEELHAQMNKPLPCETLNCERPVLFEDNYETMSVYNLCQGQLLVSGMGDVIGIRIEAVKVAMEMLGVNDPDCIDKINAFVGELYRKE